MATLRRAIKKVASVGTARCTVVGLPRNAAMASVGVSEAVCMPLAEVIKE